MLENKFWFKRRLMLFVVAILSGILLAACNMPGKNSAPDATATNTPTSISTEVVIAPVNKPTPSSTPTQVPTLCDNTYQPTKAGDTWLYTGTNTSAPSYQRSDSITSSNQNSFTLTRQLSTIPYNVDYTCTGEGLVANNPIQQYLGALLAQPNSQLKVDLLSTSGVSLPKNIKPGDTWQQTAEVDTTINGTRMNGLIIFDYTAVGLESVTVPAGTYNALRVDGTIRIEVSPFRILAGTITTTTWYAPNVGIIQTDSTSNVPGVTFTDHEELTSYTPSTGQ